jgi:peptidoglycan hydrolase-like protein with peptidoglycan-binding domain
MVGWALLVSPWRPHSSSTAASAAAATLTTAPVVRTDIADRQQVAGVLGYAGTMTVVDQLPGIVTAIVAPGEVISAGGRLAEVDGRPVVVMLGARPAWRPFAIGMSDGPDVAQLEAGLEAGGFDPDHAITIDDHFSAATAADVRRWQQALGQPQTGIVDLGSVAFLSRPIRVTSDQAALGSLVAPGQPLLSGTTTDHDVTVALDPSRQSLVHVADTVVVTMPDGTTTIPGRVTFVSRVAESTSAAPSSTGSGTSSGSPTVQVTVALTHQAAAGHLDQAPVQVSITDQLHKGVLAVPVTALIGVPGGGYAVTDSGGAEVRVTVGLFDDLTQLVEISGPGVTAGLPVQVPRS